jgi:hypothetical protein
MAGGDTAIEARRQTGRLKREPSEPCQGHHSLAKHHCDPVALRRPRHRVKRAAHSLTPPFRRMNSPSGSESGLYTAHGGRLVCEVARSQSVPQVRGVSVAHCGSAGTLSGQSKMLMPVAVGDTAALAVPLLSPRSAGYPGSAFSGELGWCDNSNYPRQFPARGN